MSVSIREEQVAKTVVTAWTTTRLLVCDACAATVQVDPLLDGKDRPHPAGWLVLKHWDLPSWYDLEVQHVTVRHFDSLACLASWVDRAART